MRSDQLPSNHSRTLRPQRVRRGSALIEFALVVTLALIPLVMGTIEFGIMGKNSLTIANATREGARAAAIGNTTTQIRDRVTRFASPLSIAAPNGSIVLEYSTDKGVSYQTLLDNSARTANAAPTDALVRVRVSSRNQSVTGALGMIFDRQLPSAVTMRRETNSG